MAHWLKRLPFFTRQFNDLSLTRLTHVADNHNVLTKKVIIQTHCQKDTTFLLHIDCATTWIDLPQCLIRRWDFWTQRPLYCWDHPDVWNQRSLWYLELSHPNVKRWRSHWGHSNIWTQMSSCLDPKIILISGLTVILMPMVVWYLDQDVILIFGLQGYSYVWTQGHSDVWTQRSSKCLDFKVTVMSIRP